MKMSLKRLFAVMVAVMTVATVFAGSAMAAGFVPFGSTANVNTNTNTSTESQLDPSKEYGKIVNVKNDVNFRSKASSSSSKVKGCTALPKDAVVEILGTSGSWYKLSYEGYVGYVKKSYVEKIEVPENTGSSSSSSNNNGFGGFGSNTGSSSGSGFDPFGNSSSSSGTFNPFGGSSSSGSSSFDPFGSSSSTGNGFSGFGSNTGSSNTQQQEPAKTYGEIANVSSYVNFRSKASNSASKVKGCTTLKKGAKVEILGTEGDWYKVSYNDYTGYVKQDYVEVISDSSSNTGSSNTGSSTTTPAGPNISSTKAILSSTDKKNINAMGSNLAAAQKKNSDAKGYIYVPGTNVNYPIMYRKDLNYYNDRTIDHVKKSSGSIYSFVSAMPGCGIYPVSGHNSRSSGTMFHELHDWQNSLKKSPSKTNRIAFIQVPGSNYTQWEVFAMYELKNNSAAKQQQSINMMYHTINRGSGPNTKEKQAWIDMQTSMSEVRFGTTATPNDQIVVLMTCGDNYEKVSYARLYFFLKGVA